MTDASVPGVTRVLTVSGDLSHYDDGRRDLRLSMEEHFIEQVEAFNRVVFDNDRQHVVQAGDLLLAR